MLPCLVGWHPPHDGDEIALAMSVRRDSSVFGKPRITYMKAAEAVDGETDLANFIFAEIRACSPLNVTSALGAAIAGRLFLIRFISPRTEERAAF